MIPGMSSKDIAKAMKKLGIKQEEISANEVVIKTSDKEIIITNPQVSKVNMMGQETFQITGEVNERELSKEPEIKEEDIETVMQQTNASREEALESIKRNNGDLAKAIIELNK